MAVDIILNGKSKPCNIVEQHEKITKFLGIATGEFARILELDTLDRIVISTHFTDAVCRIQEEYEINESGHTDRPEGVAVAKVLHTSRPDNALQQTIVLSLDLVTTMFSTAPDQLIHLVHHELCHVHDNYMQQKMHSRKARCVRSMNALERTLAHNAKPIWSEYVAVRLSCSSVSELKPSGFPPDDLYVSHLLDVIESCGKRIGKAKAEYRYHGNTLNLFLFCQEETSFLFMIAAKIHGYIDGLNLAESDIKNIDAYLRETFYFDCWVKQRECLRHLYSIYPEWDDIHQLGDLGQAILCCWNALEIYPVQQPGGEDIYVHVPL